MVKLALVLTLMAIPLAAQFRMIEVTFQGIGCASCVESMPDRLRRLRGVETAEVDTAKNTVTLRLGHRNRVRLEQVRDFIEQDGTKTVKAVVEVAGEVSGNADKWTLEPSGLGAQYGLEKGESAITAGPRVVQGDVPFLHPDGGRLTIRVTRIDSSE